MESQVYQMNWFHSGKHSFYLWDQIRILVDSNLQKSPPWKLKSPPQKMLWGQKILCPPSTKMGGHVPPVPPINSVPGQY